MANFGKVGAVVEELVVALGPHVEQHHSAIPGVRGDFLEAEMSQLRTTRHEAGIRRSRGREHSSRRKGGERVRHVQVTNRLVWNARDYRGKDAAGAGVDLWTAAGARSSVTRCVGGVLASLRCSGCRDSGPGHRRPCGGGLCWMGKRQVPPVRHC